MQNCLYPCHFDLITPDGQISSLKHLSPTRAEADVVIENISPVFVGFSIAPELVFFNLKSSLAQLGLDGQGFAYMLDSKHGRAEVKVQLNAIGSLGAKMLPYLENGAYIGKLFAADDRRRVRDPDYLGRMFGRVDRLGRPLLSLGGMAGSEHLILEKRDGRTLAYLTLRDGIVVYDETIFGFLPTVARALKEKRPIRELLTLHQRWLPGHSRLVHKNEMLLVKTQPLRIRTVFGVVVNEQLSTGYRHTSARVLEPDENASGDIYELYGDSPTKEINDIPLEFYTLEPHREHVFFSDRDQLLSSLENPEALFRAFATAPKPQTHTSAVFIVKGTQLLALKGSDWEVRQPRRLEFPGMSHTERQALIVERYIEQQPEFPFLKAIEEDLITSQGVLFSYYFPSPFMKRLLLGNQMQRNLKAIYFHSPSFTHGSYFSAEDRAMLNDLAKFGIAVYWVDEMTQKILRYAQKTNRDSGMFVPERLINHYLESTVFGIYGSNLKEGKFENELFTLLQSLLQLRDEVDHPLLYPQKPLSLVTGGGPGAMAVGNRVAQNLQILSCANLVDFHRKGNTVINEQKQNLHVEAKMTYRIDKLVERQSEFNLDFPIFLEGGIGTDFEFALEQVRRKVGTSEATPVLLFGPADYWRQKITPSFQCNLQNGTIESSEWVSNCFYSVENAKQALNVLKHYFLGKLSIGKGGAVFLEGFCDAKTLHSSI